MKILITIDVKGGDMKNAKVLQNCKQGLSRGGGGGRKVSENIS